MRLLPSYPRKSVSKPWKSFFLFHLCIFPSIPRKISDTCGDTPVSTVCICHTRLLCMLGLGVRWHIATWGALLPECVG